MQQLWSRLLAGEANAPGTFSKRTINLLADLDKSDAELFKSFCGYCWMFGEATPLIFEVRDAIYGKSGITFATASHLESLGLVRFENIGYVRSGLPDKFVMYYYGRPLNLQKQPGASEDLPIGQALLTNAGTQLARICGGAPVDGFYEYAIEQFKKNNYSAV